MRVKRLTALLSILLLTTACEVGWVVEKCGPDKYDYCVRVVIIFADPGNVSASSLNITREVDPNVLDYQGTVTPQGTVTVTLGDGSTRIWSGDLFYDSAESAAIPAATSGNRVFAFRAVDQTSLQQFIDTWQASATSVEVTTDVTLTQIGASDSTVVEAQGKRSASVEYIGSTSVPLEDLVLIKE